MTRVINQQLNGKTLSILSNVGAAPRVQVDEQDILANWKNKRFVMVEHALFDLPPKRQLVVLTDVSYWNEHYEELKEWCDINGGIVEGMTAQFDEDVATLFALRWS